MSHRFAVVHEAVADFEIATELADRVLVESIDWLEDDQLSNLREWVATESGGNRLTWKSIPKSARDAGIRARGCFEGEPGGPDAAATRRAILYLLATVPNLRAIVLVRDQDDQPARRAGLEQARIQDRSGVAIVIGLANVERECWVISGFDPQDDKEETARLDSERQNLGFDPRYKSHELTAGKNDQAPRSPKRVLGTLTGHNRDRERLCWSNVSLEILRERGVGNELTAYLDEIRDRLAVLIGHVA